VRLRWRRDPLTGASARILTGEKLQPQTRTDLTQLTAKPAFCPFDAEYLYWKPRRRAMDFAIAQAVDNGFPQGVIETLDWFGLTERASDLLETMLRAIGP